MRQSNEKAAADGDAPDLCQGGASVYHKSQPESRSSFISDRVSLALVPETSSRRPLFHSLGRGMPRPVSLTWHHPPARHSPFPELKIVGNPAAYGRLQQNSAQHEQNVTCGCSRGRRSDWGLWLPSRMKIPPYSLKRQPGRKSLAKSKKKSRLGQNQSPCALATLAGHGGSRVLGSGSRSRPRRGMSLTSLPGYFHNRSQLGTTCRIP